MITLNLLPDIKSDYLKAKRLRDRIVAWSALVGGGFIGVVVVAVIIVGIQWVIVERTKDSIATSYTQLQETEDIITVLTVQNQLSEMPRLHENKPRATRLFSYLSTLTPNSASLNTIEVDFEEGSIEIRGNADSVRDFNVLVDTYKAAQYRVGPTVDPEDDSVEFESLATQLEEDFSDMELGDPRRAFTNVVSSLSIHRRTSDGVGFSLEFSFDPDLFDARYSAVEFTIPEFVDRDPASPDVIFDDSNEFNGGGE